jgi:hypothetical protein
MTVDMDYLQEIYKKRDKMFHEISLLLEDTGVILEIGNRDYRDFEDEVLMPVAASFYTPEKLGKSRPKIWKYKGHKVSLIKYYCDTFNFKEPDATKDN